VRGAAVDLPARERPCRKERRGEEAERGRQRREWEVDERQPGEEGEGAETGEPIADEAQLETARQRDPPVLDPEDAPAAAEDKPVGADHLGGVGHQNFRSW
jgi:hypothetical protein